jgi:Peptidoglycan-binding protein, CsiV
VFAFDDDANRSAAYPLDAETRAQPALPTSAGTVPVRTAPAAASVAPTAAEQAAKLLADHQTQLQARSYKFEPSNTFLLASEDGRLQRSNVYRVVFHRAWIQPVPDRDRLRPVLIQIRETSGGPPRIEGIIGVTRGRYLHLDAKLWYAVHTNQAAVDSIGADEPLYMELREERRMRSGELHYLDHPKLGVLARVDPIAPPDALLAELARLGAPQAAPAAPAQ